MVLKGAVATWWWSMVILSGVVISCTSASSEAEQLYALHCGSCHALPKPDHLPKSVWRDRVLPEMGSRMGMRFVSYNPLKGLSDEERLATIQSGVYPQQATLSTSDWEKLTSYILEEAPDSLEKIRRNPEEIRPLSQFVARPLDLDGRAGALVTYLNFHNGHLMAGDAFGQLWAVGDSLATVVTKVTDPVVGWTLSDTLAYLTEIGIMPPTQQETGKLWKYENTNRRLILDSLHRPVQTVVTNLDGRDENELLIAEFGHHTGQLSMVVQCTDSGMVRKSLLTVPGIVRILVADMNRDAKKDIVVMATQGQEAVYILYQEENLRFTTRKVLEFEPEYGSSWMELADYDQDGDLDIITVNGDNADFSYTAKPYHGVRIFINDGSNNFGETFFYPMYGATRVIAEDFDQDGDVDIAVTAYFPEFTMAPQEAFVYLENLNTQDYTFQAYTFPGAQDGRWLVMTSGDHDGDGDTDLVIGSFIYAASPTPSGIMKTWRTTHVDLMLMENQFVK